MTFVRKIVFTAAALIGMAMPAQAASVISATVGLSGADTQLNFGEVAIANNTAVTTQFLGSGVTFSNGIRYNPQTTNFANISGDRLGNFSPVSANFSMFFVDDVADATFSMVTNPTNTTFTALLNGVIVESFNTATTFSSASNFYGFTGIVFDQITVSVGGNSGAMLLDNLAFNAAPPPPPAVVPLPASGMMLLFALGGIGLYGRRRAG